MKIKYFLTIIAFSLTLVSCGDPNSTKSKEYQLTQDLDNKNYDSVISQLNNCPNSDSQCLLNLAVAYLGKAGFDVLTLGKDVLAIENKYTNNTNSTDKSNEYINLFVSKLNGNNFAQTGMQLLSRLLKANDFRASITPEEKGRICTLALYVKNSNIVQQACVASNPLLLKDILENKSASDSKATKTSLTLTDMMGYLDTIKVAAPEVSTLELTKIIQGSKPSAANDKNSNGSMDSIEASACLTNIYQSYANEATFTPIMSNGCSKSADFPNVVATLHSVDTFSAPPTGSSLPAKLSNIHSAKVVIGSSNPNTFYRLVKKVTDSVTKQTLYSVLQTQNACLATNYKQSCATTAVNGTSCVPCPTEPDSIQTKTVSDSINENMNTPEKFNAIASMVSSGDEGKTDAQKQQELRNKICKPKSGDASSINLGSCEVSNGKLVIPQKAAIDYFSKH